MKSSLHMVGNLVVSALQSQNYALAEYGLNILKTQADSIDVSGQYWKIATHIFSGTDFTAADLVLSARGCYLPEELATIRGYSGVRIGYHVAKQFLSNTLEWSDYREMIYSDKNNLDSLVLNWLQQQKKYDLYQRFGGDMNKINVLEITQDIEWFIKSGANLDNLSIATKESAEYVMGLIKRLNTEGYKANFSISKTEFISSFWFLNVRIDYNASSNMVSIPDIIRKGSVVLGMFEVNNEKDAEEVMTELAKRYDASLPDASSPLPFRVDVGDGAWTLSPFVATLSKYKLIYYNNYKLRYWNFESVSNLKAAAQLLSIKEFILHNGYAKFKELGYNFNDIKIEQIDQDFEVLIKSIKEFVLHNGYAKFKELGYNFNAIKINKIDQDLEMLVKLGGNLDNLSVHSKEEAKKVIDVLNSTNADGCKANFLLLNTPFVKSLSKHQVIKKEDTLLETLWNKASKLFSYITGSTENVEMSREEFLETSIYSNNFRMPFSRELFKSFLSPDFQEANNSEEYRDIIRSIFAKKYTVSITTNSKAYEVLKAHTIGCDMNVDCNKLISSYEELYNQHNLFKLIIDIASLGLTYSSKSICPICPTDYIAFVNSFDTSKLSCGAAVSPSYNVICGISNNIGFFSANGHGTILHELSHYIFIQMYQNSFLPYPRGTDPQQEQDYTTIYSSTISSIQNSGEGSSIPYTLPHMLTYYDASQYQAELIVRYPEIISEYGQEIADKYMPGMKEYFKKHIIPDAIEYIKAHQDLLVDIPASYDYDF